ncbi:hypothetical protein EDB81DRAFT_753682 [Dactylonectria macrodidyma]|uniref:Uncharacterized protein n=1 Tax=Dactylonectria macrodidyma TaxID=307937 RepID=A0A9P9JLU2_9HYPO|nr:hypothetical protein EDB81DRAFT_753682 [Dactylonectria macrodidyma]
MATIPQPATLDTEVWCLKEDARWEHEKPYYSNIPFDHPDAKQTNLESVPRPVRFTDIRGAEGHFGLDANGFCVHRTNLVDIEAIHNQFSDSYWIQRVYYAKVSEWMRDDIGGDKIERIHIYDHTDSFLSCSVDCMFADVIRTLPSSLEAQKARSS